MANSPEYHVGCGAFGIYAGTITKDGKLWKNKSEVTDEALRAVRDYLIHECVATKRTSAGYEWEGKDGKTVKLMLYMDEEVGNNTEEPEGK